MHVEREADDHNLRSYRIRNTAMLVIAVAGRHTGAMQPARAESLLPYSMTRVLNGLSSQPTAYDLQCGRMSSRSLGALFLSNDAIVDRGSRENASATGHLHLCAGSRSLILPGEV